MGSGSDASVNQVFSGSAGRAQGGARGAVGSSAADGAVSLGVVEGGGGASVTQVLSGAASGT